MPDEQPEDLATVSTADLVTRLIAELEVRHQEDVFILFMKRPTDGGVATIFSRVCGDAYAVEGALAVLHRWAKRGNDHDPCPFRGEFWTDGAHEAEPLPGAEQTADGE